MKEILTNEVFIGLVTAIFGGLMTYLGVARKSKSDAAGIYTTEIRNIIQELKEQNREKDLEISRLEDLAEKLRLQLAQSQELLDKLELKEKEMNALLEEKEKQIVELSRALKEKERNKINGRNF